jgi:hypothetical protein
MQTRQLMRLAGVAKKIIDKRGGTERLKQDVEELKGIAKGEGTLEDKARRAAQRLREPAPGEQPAGAGGPAAPGDADPAPSGPPPDR